MANLSSIINNDSFSFEPIENFVFRGGASTGGRGGWFDAGFPENLRAKSIKDEFSNGGGKFSDNNEFNEIRGAWNQNYIWNESKNIKLAPRISLEDLDKLFPNPKLPTPTKSKSTKKENPLIAFNRFLIKSKLLNLHCNDCGLGNFTFGSDDSISIILFGACEPCYKSRNPLDLDFDRVVDYKIREFKKNKLPDLIGKMIKNRGAKMPTKYCENCNQEKHTMDFGKDDSTDDGFTEFCSKCNAEKYFKKTCKACKKKKYRAFFEKDDSMDDGYKKICIPCQDKIDKKNTIKERKRGAAERAQNIDDFHADQKKEEFNKKVDDFVKSETQNERYAVECDGVINYLSAKNFDQAKKAAEKVAKNFAGYPITLLKVCGVCKIEGVKWI